ncbi:MULTISPECIES: alpha/beta hydrolase [unclassified Streptomyces]|uniref:alpha/beta fold hydrolase n=1 Tax=unclassified Streptomyces TaxID=2593676 RepID=UPI00342B3785
MRARRLSWAAATAAGLLGLLSFSLAPSASAHQSSQSHPKPTVVLVHGAFADASGWNGVVKRLLNDGYKVVAPANPLRGLPQDATYIAGVLNNIKGPVVLVGHSYGGAVITQAAAGDPDVKALVYVAAFMPDRGETLGQLAARSHDSQLQPALRPAPFANADGSTGTELTIDPAQFHKVFAADLPASQTRIMAVEQRPISASAFEDAPTAAAWHTIPSWALVAKQDKAIGADLERFEARRAGSHTVQVDGSHVVMISRPDVVTHLVETAARTTAQ